MILEYGEDDTICKSIANTQKGKKIPYRINMGKKKD